MDSRVKRRLVGALVLIGFVLILIPIVFHSGNMKADDIAMTPIAPLAPAKLTVDAVVAQQAKTLAATQQFLSKQAPSSPSINKS